MATVDLGKGGTFEYTKGAEWYSTFTTMSQDSKTATKVVYEDAAGNRITFEGTKLDSNTSSEQIVTDVTIENADGVMVYDISGLTSQFNNLISSSVLTVLQNALVGNDTVSGTKDSDELVSALNNGNDVINGYGGDDIFRGGPGDNTLHGGNGDDQLHYNITEAVQSQGIVLDAAKGIVTNAWGGHDTISGFEEYTATALGDKLFGSKVDETFIGLNGKDRINGKGGFDTVDYSMDQGAGGSRGIIAYLQNDKITDGFGNVDRVTGVEHVIGTSFADRFVGTKGDETFEGLGGNDTLTGGGGSDSFAFTGTFGDDVIRDFNKTKDGHDTISFDHTILRNFNDLERHWAESGDDVIITLGTETITLKNIDIKDLDSSMFSFSDPTHQDVVKVQLGPGGTFEETDGADWTKSFGGMDLSSKTETKAIYEDSKGNQIILEGSDFKSSGGDNGIVTDLVIENGDGKMIYDISGLTLNFDSLSALANGDSSSAVLDVLKQALGGDDRISGTEGSDELVPVLNLGDNVINGFGGDDIFDAGPGANTLIGGKGTDELHYDIATYTGFPQTVGVIVDATKGTATNAWGGHDEISGFEMYFGTTRDDKFFGSDADETFSLFGGSDKVDGQGGFDTVDYSKDGGSAGINVNLKTGVATDSAGNTDKLTSIEHIIGTASGDTFVGSKADETYDGQKGADTVTGGGGSDSFSFVNSPGSPFSGPTKVVVTDFNNDGAGGHDTIEFIDTILTSFHDLKQHWDTVGNDVVINIGLETFTLQDVDIHDLDSSMFTFTTSDV